MADIIQIRRDTAANWTASNPVLADGEIGLERGNEYWKVGDGVTSWNSLPYIGVGPAGADGTNGADGQDGQGVPTGGTANQLIRKVSSTDFDTEWTNILTGLELKDWTESEHTIPAASGAVTCYRTNGGMQDFTPNGDVTLTWDLPSGAKQQLLITPGTHTISWGGDYWMTDVIDTVGKARVHVIAENWGGTIYLWDGGGRA